MTEFTKDISDTVILTIKEINEKIRGLNFLETLKVNLFENLIKLINNYDFPIKENVKYELEVNQALRNIKISINYFMNSI